MREWKWFIFLSSNEEGVNERKCMGECVFLCINGLTEIFFERHKPIYWTFLVVL